MSDLTDRLRTGGTPHEQGKFCRACHDERAEAADRIEHLEATLARVWEWAENYAWVTINCVCPWDENGNPLSGEHDDRCFRNTGKDELLAILDGKDNDDE